MRNAHIVKGFITACLLFAAAAVNAQFSQPGTLPSIDGAARAAIVDSVCAVIDSIYVLEKPAKQIVTELKSALAAGEYDDFTDPALFAKRLYDDCQRVNHDGHFRIFALAPLDPSQAAPGQDESPIDVERRKRFFKENNYWFKKAEILPCGIGYLRFDAFANGDEAFKAAAAALNFVANSNAVILDLRNNGGGNASMIRFICGYLFPEEKHLINWDIRAEGKTVQSYSADFVPGKRIAEQPVYILTSRNTFSAAEEFTFDLRNLERAIIVGDTTGGGGHTVSQYVFDFDKYRIGIRVPYGRAYNPENNEGWEGVGVIPHIPVPSDKALEVAKEDAIRKILDTEKDEQFRTRYEWELADIESKANPPAKLTTREMKKYAGSYGPRRVFIKNGGLYYQREKGPEYELVTMGNGMFRVGDIDYFRISFEINGKGRIVKLVGHYSDGRTDGNDRDGR